MTTAHRATYKSAKANYNGVEQGNYFTGGVGTTALAARDLPGQQSLKRRLQGQGTEAELGTKDFKKILEEKEAAHTSKRLKMLDDYDDSDDEVDDGETLTLNNSKTTKILGNGSSNDSSNGNDKGASSNGINSNNNDNVNDDSDGSDDDHSDE